ncbi:hypothetical protein D3C76_1141150 [compost metagenome]
MEKKGPDHYRYYAALSEEGVHVKCERFIVIGETERCYYVISENSEHLVGKEADWAQSLVKKRTVATAIPTRWRRYSHLLPGSAGGSATPSARRQWLSCP